MNVYKKRTRSDEKLEPSQFRPGLIVWVPGQKGREEHICIGIGEHIPVAEHRRRKAAQALAAGKSGGKVRRKRSSATRRRAGRKGGK